MSCLYRFVSCFVLIPLSAFPLYPQSPQTTADSATERTTFKSTVRAVLVDVVVTNSKDEPVTGLPKTAFQVFEDGKPQTLASFDEHAGLPDFPALTLQAKLPPNVFSNLPMAKAGDAANVLLLDALNTQMSDQSYVHSQMINYIKNLRPGTRLAIFTLGARLRFVQGFTGDPALLMAAVNGKKSAGNPELSPLLATGAETDANGRISAQVQEMMSSASAQGGAPQQGFGSAGSGNGLAQMQASIAAMQSFQRETESFHTDVRVKTTLEAMQRLALYLQGIPGRKNVIWFSGSFPLHIFGSVDPNGADPERDYKDEVVHTANLLASAQVAIYPIGAQGVAVDSHYDFSGPQPPKIASTTTEQQMTQYQTGDLQNGSIQRNAGFTAMNELATNTGGEAFLNTNGLMDALDHVLTHGTHYYTLTYSPTNKAMDESLRKISVKVTGGTYRLAYRRGYYASNAVPKAVAQMNPMGDPLRPLMDHGTPDVTEIFYTMRVTATAVQSLNLQAGAGTGRAGDNDNLKGPLTRYTINFTVAPDHLTLEPSADGVRHGKLEVTLIGYDNDGTPLNWMVRMLELTLPPERYAAVLAKGLPFKLEIDVPTSTVYLRSGIYDQGTSKSGTLEIPIAAVVAHAGEGK